MKRNGGLPLLVLAMLMPAAGGIRGGDLTPENLRCEYRVDPEGIDVSVPRLSWTLAADHNGQEQTAYRVLVASSPEILERNEGDLWDSKKVISDQTIHIPYNGRTLISRMKACWKVQVWDMNGNEGPWSKEASWSMGLLKETDWEAEWIADPAMIHNARSENSGYHSKIVSAEEIPQTITLDLNKRMVFNGIRFTPSINTGPGTRLYPLRFRIEVSDSADFSDAILLVDHTGTDVPDPGFQPRTYRFGFIEKRYIRLTVTRLNKLEEGKYAFALSELEVLREFQNIAVDAAVFASGSRETTTWSLFHLTDGKDFTRKPPRPLPATMVRKEFRIPGPVKKATAYVSALGLYEFYLNGRRVGDRLLAPEWTDYDMRVSYQTYDVTGLLREEENTAAALLGEGWYAGELMMAGRFNYGSFSRFLLQLEIELKDGTFLIVASDGTWRATSNGPLCNTGIYDGENYDARKEQPGWDLPGFNDNSWSHASTFSLDARKLVWLRNEPIRVERELAPVALTEPQPGVYIFDMGQNMVGWCRIRAEGTAGSTVTIRHGEAVNQDGTLYTANLRGDHQINTYVPASDGPFEYEPRFTYHGFRFVELSGLAAPPAMESVTGRVFHSSSPFSGWFECSDPSLNRLMENIQWTQRGNLMSSPNDCPQRDERLGWMGDIQSFAQTSIFNMDMAAFFTKFMQDTRDGQADDGRFPNYAPHPGDENRYNSGVPAWSDAGVFIPWNVWVNYADIRLLEEQFGAACRWVDYIHRNNPDLVWRNGRNNDYNDWLNGDQIKAVGWPAQGGEVPRDVFATAFFSRSARIVADMAVILGRSVDARHYGRLADGITEAFNREFVQPDGRISGNTQAGYALALHFSLLPDTLRAKAANYTAEDISRYDGHLSTGIQTSHRAMLELSRNGYENIAWQLITDRRFPSWLYMIDNGATTIWERWDGYVRGRGFQDPVMNSLNHWALGSVGEWMWRNIIGFNPDEGHPGWKHFTIAPQPGGGVTWARGEYMSIRGRIACSWEIRKDVLHLEAVVPPNTTAMIRVPTTNAGEIKVNGNPGDPDTFGDEYAVFRVRPGSYLFQSPFEKSSGN